MSETSWASDLAAITVSNNADWNESFDVMDGGQPFDLTGCTIHMQLRRDPLDAAAYLDLASPLRGISLATAADGTPNAAVHIYAPLVMMSAIPQGKYLRDILIRRGSEVLFAGRGDVEVIQGITRT